MKRGKSEEYSAVALGVLQGAALEDWQQNKQKQLDMCAHQTLMASAASSVSERAVCTESPPVQDEAHSTAEKRVYPVQYC